MCGTDVVPAVPLDSDPNAAEPFPWSARVVDAHCHPTDTVASLAQIPAMRAATLTAMATRAQDQALVAQLARDQPGAVVPAFGWHPWFAHQLYDDTTGARVSAGELTTLADKRAHLALVLTPSPAAYADTDPKRAAALSADLDALAASLPSIRPLSALIDETRQRLVAHPNALVGEIGLDKAFRVPEPPSRPSDTTPETTPETTPGTREGRRLSPFRVVPAHQAAVLAAQLRLAAELRRPVSVHGVQAHGQLHAALAATWAGQERTVLSRRERHQIAGLAGLDDDDDDDDDDEEPTVLPHYPPAFCLHSFSGPVDVLRQYLDARVPAAVYVSVSTAVNASSPSAWARTAAVVAACPDDRLLLESDLHTAGPAMDRLLEDVYRRVCAVKHWTLAEGVARIARNYDAFVQAR